MRDLIYEINKWLAKDKTIALATVIKTWGSSPRKAGAHMAITSGGEFAGSVSGGCVESELIDTSSTVIKTGKSVKLHFGVSDESAWEVSLACGGEIDVFVQPLDKVFFFQLQSLIKSEKMAWYSIVIEGSEKQLGHSEIIEGRIDRTFPFIEQEKTPKGKITKFINAISPSPTLIIIGGVHIAIKLAQLAKTLEFKTIVIDPRGVFGNASRFPEIDQILTTWPQDAFENLKINNSTAIVTLTHDPKIDDPALVAALNSPAFYVGALGSRKTQKKRHNRLREMGLSNSLLNKIRGPIGLDIGANSPPEIAVSIMAEIVAVRNGLL
jgi:xanthine dehydrogenase accessory factor